MSKLTVFGKMFLLVILAGVTIGLLRSAKPAEVKGIDNPNPGPKVKATWIWDSPLGMTEDKMREQIDFAKKTNINVIYLFAEDYMTITRDPDEASRKKRMDEFNSKMQTFLAMAQNNGISVEALGGAPDWANDENKDLPVSLLKYVINYNRNASNPIKFSGVHYDIEFYAQQGFGEDKPTYSINFLKLVNQLVTIKNNYGANDVLITFDIPPWTNNYQTTVPPVYYKGTTAPVFEHLLTILNDTNGAIVLMSYRDHIVGSNGTNMMSKSCFDSAEKYKKTRIIVGIETSDNGNSKTTFFGSSRAKIDEAQKQIEDYFSGDVTFGGVAIHSLNSYMHML